MAVLFSRVVFGILCLLVCWTVIDAILLTSVTCPKRASNCQTDTFNNLIPNLGCLGCQGGCKTGYMMTSNPKYHRATNDSTGHYLYSGVTIPNNVDVFEPQWVCTAGSHCPLGYFQTQIGPQTSCAWCGEGCEQCTSYNNCQMCFPGYHLNRHRLPGGKTSTDCTHSGVSCPNPDTHCTYKDYVIRNAGCLGCTSCQDGYIPTVNSKYIQPTQDYKGHYMYHNIPIRNDRNVHEPRYTCEVGPNCKSGYYKRVLQGSGSSYYSTCDKCPSTCTECTSISHCTK